MTGAWRVAAASAVGTSHLKAGLPCQDSHECRLCADREGAPVLVAAVADGAGSAKRAEVGAQLACEALANLAEVYLRTAIVADLDEDRVRDWVDRVRRHLEEHAALEGASPRDYAATLVAAVVGEDAAVFIQLGDGGIVVSDDEGSWCWVHWPQHGEYANTTCFVTESKAAEQVMIELVPRPVREVALFSDGLERLVLHLATRSAHAPFFDQMFPLVRAKAPGIDAGLGQSLARYLGSPQVCDRTDDDKTLILATRRSGQEPG
jgi:hypothetical protein